MAKKPKKRMTPGADHQGCCKRVHGRRSDAAWFRCGGPSVGQGGGSEHWRRRTRRCAGSASDGRCAPTVRICTREVDAPSTDSPAPTPQTTTGTVLADGRVCIG